MNETWTQIAARGRIELDAAAHEKLSRFLDLLLSANRRMNLTRITERPAAEIQHVGDALTLLTFLPAGPIRVADVGSGGGVPGIPLAIVRPDVRMLLIESTRKKAEFLREAARELGLKNLEVSGDRAEAVGRRPDAREQFDVVIARAVGTLDWLAEWCLPLVARGGKMLAMKGARAADELSAAATAIRLLGGGTAVVHPVELPGADHHVVVEIPKEHRTPPSFPRDPTAAREPIRNSPA